jgi:hypothetical protein
MALLPALPLLRCVSTLNKFGHPIDGDVGDAFTSWTPGEELLFQGSYSTGLVLDIGWRCWSATDNQPKGRGFVINVVRGAYLDWYELVIDWRAAEIPKLFEALRLVDEWCSIWGHETVGKTSLAFPKLRNILRYDRLSTLGVKGTLEQLESAGALGEHMYAAQYGDRFALQVDWQAIDCLQGVEGEPYVFKGFKVRLLDQGLPDSPIIEWAAETFAELFLAVQSIDQWTHAELLPRMNTGG